MPQEAAATRVRILEANVDRMLDGVMRIIGERDEARRHVAALADMLVARRAMEPRHSHPDHDCPECALLSEIRQAEAARERRA